MMARRVKLRANSSRNFFRRRTLVLEKLRNALRVDWKKTTAAAVSDKCEHLELERVGHVLRADKRLANSIWQDFGARIDHRLETLRRRHAAGLAALFALPDLCCESTCRCTKLSFVRTSSRSLPHALH